MYDTKFDTWWKAYMREKLSHQSPMFNLALREVVTAAWDAAIAAATEECEKQIPKPECAEAVAKLKSSLAFGCIKFVNEG